MQEGNARESSENMQQEKSNFFEITEKTTYSMDDHEFSFTPEKHGIRVYSMENGEEAEYGFLRKTTTDGFYIMTSTLTENTYFGRFDEQGNLRSYRYDAEKDAVIEENFMIQDPVAKRDRDRRNDPAKNNINNKEN